jgi:solute carrier family 25 protein 39/40
MTWSLQSVFQGSGSVGRPSAIRLASHIVRCEGVLALWSGLRPTLIMSIPSNVLYFAAYDFIKARMDAVSPPQFLHVVPLLSGGGARMVAATLVSPMELVRTQMQSNRTIQSIGFLPQLRTLLASPSGYLAIFRGLTPTLQRDIPFSGIYWTVYENVNRKMNLYMDTSPPIRSFISGATGGMVAAFLTTPFDVAKTHVQIFRAADVSKGHEATAGTIAILRRLWIENRFRGLFAGMPRERSCREDTVSSGGDEAVHPSSYLPFLSFSLYDFSFCL